MLSMLKALLKPHSIPSSLDLDYDSFRHVLEDPTLFRKFLVFAQSVHAAENLLFYDTYRQLLRRQEMASDPMLIALVASRTGSPTMHLQPTLFELQDLYFRYIGLGASYPVNLPSDITTRIHDQVVKGNWTLGLFDEAANHIFLLMYENLYMKWWVESSSSGDESLTKRSSMHTRNLSAQVRTRKLELQEPHKKLRKARSQPRYNYKKSALQDVHKHLEELQLAVDGLHQRLHQQCSTLRRTSSVIGHL
jgi:hypothetical protein